MQRKANKIRRSNAGIAAEIFSLEIVRNLLRRKMIRKEKFNVAFRDYDVDDYGDGVILTCFENHSSEYFQYDENLELDDEMTAYLN